MSKSHQRLFVFSENDRVVQVNAIAMEGALHTFAVLTLRKCGKVAKVVSKAFGLLLVYDENVLIYVA